MKNKKIMKRIALIIASIVISIQGFTQKQITLEDIWAYYKFYPKYLDNMVSSNDGKTYTVLQFGKVNKYSYKSGKELGTVFEYNTIKDLPGAKNIASIDNYIFSPDETKILFGTKTEHIYRHSKKAYYYIYDFKAKTLTPLYDKDKQQEPSFSPDGKKVAFVCNNNLYIKDLESGKTTQITTDGKKNKIINGIPDWVYEEEFSFAKAYEWSPDGKNIAYLKFDESKVKEFCFPVYDGLYPSEYRYKYPKAGETNSTVTLHVYNLANGKTKEVNSKLYDDQYIPRIKWTKNPGVLSFIVMNRLQNELNLMLYDVNSSTVSTLIKEKDDKYIEINDALTFLDNGKEFLWLSEKDGYNHLYLYDMSGNQVKQLTKGQYEVLEVKGVDNKNGYVYYIADEQSPYTKDVFRIKLDGTGKEKLSVGTGVNDIYLNKNFSYYIISYSNSETPVSFTLFNAKGKKIRVIEDNAKLKETLKEYDPPKKEFFSFTTDYGVKLYGWMIKPKNFDPKKKYPVFMTVYGGPGYQTVMDEWDYTSMWHRYIAEQGYIVVSVDNRGTNGRGKEFRQATYGQMGKLETQDQISAVKYLYTLPYVDSTRIGIQGWSYGGFMALSCLEKGNKYFKAAISVAPVTNWRFYDSIYTERYMGLPQDNAKGYDENSPINHVSKIKGKFLLVHGTADDNVHFQNSIELIKKLVERNIYFDLMVYPNSNHGIYTGQNTRYHLFKTMTDFILENI